MLPCATGVVLSFQVILGLNTSGINRLFLGSPTSDQVEEVNLHWVFSLLPVPFRARRLPLLKNSYGEIQL